MKSRKIWTILYVVFIFMFVSGIAVGMIGRRLCLNDNKNYKTTLPEIKTIEEISTVLQNSENGYIYVCYNDGSCVNVFDENGKFLWAVSVPYLRNAYFEFKDSDLAVYNSTDAYLYNSSIGSFVSKSSSDGLDLSFDGENTGVSSSNFKIDEIYFTTYNVFKIGDDGSYIYIVQKPAWYYAFYFPLDWWFSFMGAISLGIMALINITAKYRKSINVKERKTINPRLLKMLTYIKITFAVNIFYLVLDIISGIFWQGIFCLGIFPVAIHFIISNIIILNIKDKSTFNSHEQTMLNFWLIYSFASFICAFLSVIVAASLVG